MNLLIAQLLILVLVFSCSYGDSGYSKPVAAPQEETVGSEFLIDRTDVIWGFDFLPDQNIIFTERAGKIFSLNTATKAVTEITGGPVVLANGESGLLDLKLHPSFADNNLVYLCFSTADRSQALGRGTLNGARLENFEVIFKASDQNSSNRHFGCRIEFETNSRLFLSIGDQLEDSQAQVLSSYLGKILRLNDDGSFPPDNPFVTTPGAHPEIWSLGHRNPQGIAIRPETNEVFSSEHGPTGGDELNIIEEGQNYGWPRVTIGQPAGDLGQSAPGFVDPIASWTPAIAPSGIMFYSGNEIPGWRGSLFMATLRGEHIRRITLSGRTVTSQEVLLGNLGLRFRNVRQGPDGLIYFSTDDGKIGRILP